MKFKNKKGIESGTGLIAVALIALVAIYLFVAKTPAGVGGGESCEVNPSVVSAITDTLSPGTSVSSTNYYRLNGQYLGTTSPTTKGTADVLITNTSYVAKIHNGFPVGCGSNLLTDSLYANASASLTIKNNAGTDTLTDSATGGAVNETQAAAGGSYNWDITFQGTDKKSTGDMLVILELSVPANVSSASLSGAVDAEVPSGYTSALTNGFKKAWIVPAVVGNSKAVHTFQVASATSTIILDAVYVTVYSLQPFVETDGTYNTGTKAYNSINTAKYMAMYDYDFFIKA